MAVAAGRGKILAMPDSLSLRALNRAMLARQLLLEPSKLSPRIALERVAGLQAQWPKLPFMGLWTRLADFKRDDLSELLRRRQAVRATMMRGTIHVVTTKDYLASRGAIQPVLTRGLSPMREHAAKLDMDAVLAAARAVFLEPQTFEDARDALVAKFPKAYDRALGHIARMMLPLVMVPTDDAWAFPAAAQFQLAESWLGKPIGAGTDPSSLILQYFAAFGPASAADAQSWSGLQGLRPVVEKLRPKLRTFRDERGRELFDLPDAARPDADVPAPIRFLPEFDNVLMGYQDRARVVAEEYRPFVFLSGLRVTSTVLVDGFVAATWKLERAKKQSTITVQLLEKLAKLTVAAIEQEAERVVKFMDPEAATHDVRWFKKDSAS
jgi:Winged helix DNA-binding domain